MLSSLYIQQMTEAVCFSLDVNKIKQNIKIDFFFFKIFSDFKFEEIFFKNCRFTDLCQSFNVHDINFLTYTNIYYAIFFLFLAIQVFRNNRFSVIETKIILIFCIGCYNIFQYQLTIIIDMLISLSWSKEIVFLNFEILVQNFCLQRHRNIWYQ